MEDLVGYAAQMSQRIKLPEPVANIYRAVGRLEAPSPPAHSNCEQNA